jgi:hypothetical protein
VLALDTIQPSDAAKHAGEEVYVEGIVASVHATPKGVAFINLNEAYPHQIFTGYTWSYTHAFKRLSTATDPLNRTVHRILLVNQSMNREVSFEDGPYGLRAVIGSKWSASISRDLKRRPVAELELNHAKGWRGEDLSFLAELSELLSFKIVDFTIKSVEPINHLHELRSLEVITYCKTAIEFSSFQKLENCSLEWRPNAASSRIIPKSSSLLTSKRRFRRCLLRLEIYGPKRSTSYP